MKDLLTTEQATKHTPGPWTVEGEGIRAIVRGADSTIVAVRHRLPKETHDANARLIAAAPRMLAELREILDWALMERAPLREQEIRSIRAVIAEAEGLSHD